MPRQSQRTVTENSISQPRAKVSSFKVADRCSCGGQPPPMAWVSLLHWVLGQWCHYASPYVPMGPQRQVEEREWECQRQIRGWEMGGLRKQGVYFLWLENAGDVEAFPPSFSSSSQGKTKFFYKI